MARTEADLQGVLDANLAFGGGAVQEEVVESGLLPIAVDVSSSPNFLNELTAARRRALISSSKILIASAPGPS